MIPWDKVDTRLMYTKMDRLPNSLSLFLILQACLEEGCGSAVQRLLHGIPDPPFPCSDVSVVRFLPFATLWV